MVMTLKIAGDWPHMSRKIGCCCHRPLIEPLNGASRECLGEGTAIVLISPVRCDTHSPAVAVYPGFSVVGSSGLCSMAANLFFGPQT